MTGARRCEAQTGYRLRLWLNATVIPRATYCPHPAEPGSPWCHEHQPQLTDGTIEPAASTTA